MEFETQESRSGMLKKVLVVVVIVVAVAAAVLGVVLFLRMRSRAPAAAPSQPGEPTALPGGVVPSLPGGEATPVPGQEGLPGSLQGEAGVRYTMEDDVPDPDSVLYKNETALADTPFSDVETDQPAVMTDVQKEFLGIPAEETVEYVVREITEEDGTQSRVVLQVDDAQHEDPPDLYATPFDTAPLDTPSFMSNQQKAYFGIPLDQAVRYVVMEVATEEGTTERVVLRVDDSAPGARDGDDDGLSNAEESRYGTDPSNPDADGDGFTDGKEVNNGSDPLDKNSVPPPEGPK